MTAVERYSPPDLTPAKWADLEKRADIYARSPLCPAHFKDKPEDLLVVAVTCHDLDVPFNTNTLNQFYVIDKKVAMMAQLQIALASRDQISVWFEDDAVSDTAATVCIRKPGTMEVHRYTYTADMARKAGLLDEWVEKWSQSGGKWKKDATLVVAVDGERVVPDDKLPDWAKKQIADGRVKRKDPWFKSRQQMLMARASTMGLKIEAPHTTLGMAADFDPGVNSQSPADVDPVTGEIKPGDKPEHDDDDIVDAEIVEDEEPPKPDGDLADDWDRQPLLNRIAELAEEFKDILRKRWTAAQLPKIIDPAFTKADETVAHRILSAIEEEAKQAYLNRQKRANAVMGEIGIRKDDERHAFVSMATGGATESTGHLTAEQCDAIATHAESLKAQQEQNAAEGGDPGPSEPELPLDDSEPF